MQQQNKLARPLSPYSFYQSFNKITQNQKAYNKSENPSLFYWKLSFQPLEAFNIPEPFQEKHISKERTPQSKRETYLLPNPDSGHLIKLVDDVGVHKKTEENQKNPITKKSKHQKQHQMIEDVMDVKIKEFKKLEQQIIQETALHKKSKSHHLLSIKDQARLENIDNKKNIVLSRLLREMPEDKIKLVHLKKQEAKEDFVKKIQSLHSSSRKIRPKYNINILVPHSDYDCKTRYDMSAQSPAEQSRQQSIRSISKLHRQNTMFGQNNEKQKTSTITSSPIKPFTAQPEGKYSIKPADQVQGLIQLLRGKYSEPYASERSEKKKSKQDFQKLTDHLRQVLKFEEDSERSQYRKQSIPQIDGERNFLDFQTYFFKNYQQHNNGLPTVMPQKILNNNERFADLIIGMIDNI